jgi:hypothetical protein
MTAPRHLLTVWNPSYATDPLDEHVRILLDWANRYTGGDADYEDIYVWWSKLRSANREAAKLPHYDEIMSIQQQIEDGIETHLYLTDYRSLYVAHLEDIIAENVLDDAEEEHMPAYYRPQRADLWFRIVDIRRIVSNDTVVVIEELKQLGNTRYHDRPVSLYGGMVELPLIVTRNDGKQWFPQAPSLTDGKLWVQHDADLRGQTAAMARELRENLLGPAVWSALDPATRTFLASADAVYRQRRDDPGFDFSAPAIEYSKAVEAELNALIFPHIREPLSRASYAERTANVDGRPVDLGGNVVHQPLGTLVNLLKHDDAMKRGVKLAFSNANDAKWLLGELPSHLDPVVAIRNPAAHSARLERHDVAELRARILGIGCEGLITRIARVRLRALT